MPTIVEVKLFKFDELNDEAKESARSWYRECLDIDYEFVIDDAANIADLFGLNLFNKRVKLMNGDHRYDPAVYFSGFSNQGSGACFKGLYEYKKGALKAVRSYAPQDKELLNIVRHLTRLQRKNFYRLVASTEHSGHYYHSRCMTIDVTNSHTGNDVNRVIYDEVRELMINFADWIYKKLESEYEYANSDESIDESIRCNEYDFLEDGSRPKI